MNTAFAIFISIHFPTNLKDKYSSFEPPTLILIGRSLSDSWNIKFDILDHPLSYLRTVHFHTFRSSTFILLARSIFSPGTVHFHTNDHPLWPKLVYFWTDRSLKRGRWLWGPSTLNHTRDCLCHKPLMTDINSEIIKVKVSKLGLWKSTVFSQTKRPISHPDSCC